MITKINNQRAMRKLTPIALFVFGMPIARKRKLKTPLLLLIHGLRLTKQIAILFFTITLFACQSTSTNEQSTANIEAENLKTNKEITWMGRVTSDVDMRPESGHVVTHKSINGKGLLEYLIDAIYNGDISVTDHRRNPLTLEAAKTQMTTVDTIEVFDPITLESVLYVAEKDHISDLNRLWIRNEIAYNQLNKTIIANVIEFGLGVEIDSLKEIIFWIENSPSRHLINEVDLNDSAVLWVGTVRLNVFLEDSVVELDKGNNNTQILQHYLPEKHST